MNIKSVMEYMRKNIDKNYKIEEVAKSFGYSKFEFSKKFKNHTGFSASKFLSFLKIEKALCLMMINNNNVIDTQLKTGYKSSGTFTNLFRRYTGMSPTNYKRSLKSLYNILLDYINSTEEGEILPESYFEDEKK